ncbi:Rid family hydrolase [Mycobacterium sp.]|uniref:Rid family hydrolase n=1 Tax=Mycobacterium sp. TaxID=1785 RepID=UPI003D10FFE7
MSTVVKLLRSRSLTDRAQYAYAATAPADARFVFLAGSCPLSVDGLVVGVGDFRAQATKCLENKAIALEDAGASVADVISTRVLVASPHRADLIAVWEKLRDVFDRFDPPSTLLGVTVLGYEHQLVEIEAIAAVRDQPAP